MPQTVKMIVDHMDGESALCILPDDCSWATGVDVPIEDTDYMLWEACRRTMMAAEKALIQRYGIPHIDAA